MVKIKTREQERLKAARRRARVAAVLRELKEGQPCTDCGVAYPSYVMEYDHLPGYEKVVQVSHAKTVSALLREVEKCELVCANCHAQRTHERRQ